MKQIWQILKGQWEYNCRGDLFKNIVTVQHTAENADVNLDRVQNSVRVRCTHCGKLYFFVGSSLQLEPNLLYCHFC